MKRGLIIALVALLLGSAVFLLSHQTGTQPLRTLMAHREGEMAWLAREFQLDAGQAERIRQLRAEYEPRCAEMCRQIAGNRARLDSLITAERERTPEMDALLRESANIQVECRREMLAHIYAVAAVMAPEPAGRYLALMKRQVVQPGTPHDFPSHGHHE